MENSFNQLNQQPKHSSKLWVIILIIVMLGAVVIGVIMYGVQPSGVYSTSTSVPQMHEITPGTYEFSEGAIGNPGSNQTVVYTLTLSPEHDSFPIQLAVDGFQTMQRLHAVGVHNDETVSVVFDSYAPENMNKPYTKGDVLFTLRPLDATTLKVDWKTMQPLLENTDKNNSVFLKK